MQIFSSPFNFQNPKSFKNLTIHSLVPQDAPLLLPLFRLQTSRSFSHSNSPKMLSFPLLCSLTPRRSLNLYPIHRLPSSKDRILIRGSELKLDFGGRVGRIRISDQRNMTELVGIDAFGRSNGCGEEAEAILGNGSPAVRGDLELGGFESTLNQMSKWLVAGVFGLAILLKHDASAMWAAMGSVVNSWISATLKQILNHQRPASALRSDPGMPSSHAQSIFYTAFFVVFSLFHWLGVNAFTMSATSAILICGSYLSWLRVSQRLHTISQVVVGAVLGSACSITWFWMWHSFVLKAFIASVWVRLIVVLGSITFCAAFLIHVIQHWLRDEQ